MAEYIDRNTAIAKVTALEVIEPLSTMVDVRRLLADMPAADVAPVVHGRWEQIKEWATKAKYRCSVCGREIMSAVKVNIEKYPYCNCGAKMDLEE